MNVFRWSATALIISAALATAAPADADGDSYIRYLNVRISRGSQVCTSLHNGMTAQQILDANPIVYFDYAESSMPHSTSSARTPWGIEAWSHTRKAVPAQYRAGTASVSRGSVRRPELYWPADPWHPE